MSTQIRHFFNLKKRDIHFADKRKKNKLWRKCFFYLKKILALKLEHSPPKTMKKALLLRPPRSSNELKGLWQKTPFFLLWHHCMSPDWSVRVKIWRTSHFDIYNCHFGVIRLFRAGGDKMSPTGAADGLSEGTFRSSCESLKSDRCSYFLTF